MENTFNEVYEHLSRLGQSVSGLETTGRVPFTVTARPTKAKEGDARADRRAIVSKSGKATYIYVYPDDWGSKLNSSGTRINHYTVPIDEWYSRNVKGRT